MAGQPLLHPGNIRLHMELESQGMPPYAKSLMGESPPWMPAGALRKGHQTYPHANAERAPPPDNGEGTNARPPSGIRFPTLFPWPFRDKRGCRGHGPSFELRGIRPAKAADFPDACGPNPVPSSNRDTIPYPPPLRDRPAPRTGQPPAIPGRKDRGAPARMYPIRKPLSLKRGSSVPRSSKATWRRARQVRDAERLLMATEDEPQQGI